MSLDRDSSRTGPGALYATDRTRVQLKNVVDTDAAAH